MQISPHSPSTLYAAANVVFRSTDRGDTWEVISPDLTARINRDTIRIMGVRGGDIAIARNDGVSNYGNLVSFVESRRRAGLFYTGADDGTVHVSRDNGANWTNVTSRFPGLPRLAPVARIAPSAHDEGTVYVAFDNHAANDMKPYVYMSTDFGGSFRAITTGIPDGQAVRTVTEDPKNANVLYAGTEFGLYVSLNKGGQWMRVRANLPTVPIAEITIHPRDNDMILATHGRSIWILDDITPFQQAPQAMASAAYLFDVRAAATYNEGSFRPAFGSPGDRRFWGKNPTPGAAVTYYLRGPARSVSARVSDASGAVVRELAADAFEGSTGPGVHRIQWDLRYQPIPDSLVSGGGRSGGTGPFVIPGAYRVALSVDGREVGTKTVTVNGDPLTEIAEADRKLWHDLGLSVHRLQQVAGEAALRVRTLGEHLHAVRGLVSRSPNAPAALRSAVDALDGRLATLRRQFSVPAPGEQPQSGRGGGRGGGGAIPGQLGGVKGQLMNATSRPTEVNQRYAREARADLVAAVQEINDIIATGLPAVYQALGQPQLMPVVPPMPAVTVVIP
jgi:hypothetical protein